MEFGKPDLFLTVTCNPTWEEIKANLKPWETAANRPDIICRIFALKFNAMMEEITKGELFGKVKSFLWVIEFQKRG